MSEKKFTPLVFLASLGAGGISVVPFSILQYTVPHGKGLIKYSDILHGQLPFLQEFYFRGLESIMVLFALIHFGLFFFFLPKLLSWLKTQEFKKMLQDPNQNAALLAPFISILMSMNVFLATIRYFVPHFSTNLQLYMMPAFVTWMLIWVAVLLLVNKLLHIAFSRTFDVRKISFGWLLYPFALSMTAVTGTGFAAVAKDPNIAHAAALFSLVPLTMAIFLFVVKITTIFTSHFQAENLPERQFMPAFLAAVPVVTLIAISFFRLGHYLETNFHYETEGLVFLTVVGAFAFEIWYFVFGLIMLKDYFRKDFPKNEYYVSQWALVCPFVAFAVMGAFVYKVFLPLNIFPILSAISLLVAITFFGILTYRHFRCLFSTVKPAQAKQNTLQVFECS